MSLLTKNAFCWINLRDRNKVNDNSLSLSPIVSHDVHLSPRHARIYGHALIFQVSTATYSR